MAQTTATIKLGDHFPDGSFRILVDNEIMFNCRYDPGSGLRFVEPLSLKGMTGKVIPLPWSAAFIDDPVDSHELARLNMPPAIEQSVTCDVIEHWISSGFDRSLVLPKFSFEPKLGDVIEFGDSPTCYTIIAFDTIVEPYIVMLDRPLEEKVQSDRHGYVTASVILRKRWDASDNFHIYGSRIVSRPLRSDGLVCGVSILDEKLLTVMFA